MIFATSILENEEIKVFNNAKQTRNFTHIGDVLKGICLPLNAIRICNVKSSILGEGNRRPYLELFEKSKKHSKRSQKKMMPDQPGDVS